MAAARWAVGFLFVLTSVSAAAQPLPVELRGTVTSAAPFWAENPTLPFEGKPLLARWSVPQPAAPQEIYQADAARLYIYERESLRSLNINPNLAGDALAAADDTPKDAGWKNETLAMTKSRLSVVPWTEGPAYQDWLGQLQGRSHTSFQAAARCAVLPERFGGVSFHGMTVESDYKPPARGSPTLLRATCGTGTLNASGPARLFVFNATIRLDYRKADGSAASRTVETGHFRQDLAKSGDVIVRHIDRIAMIVSNQTRLAQDTPGRTIEVRSPVLAFAGDLDIPPWVGDLTWGPSRMTASGTNLTATGVFLTRAESESIFIEGRTAEGPSVPAAPDDLAKRAAWIAGAVVSLALLWFALRFLLGLFSRVDQSTALEHPSRRALVELVRQNPGIRVQDAARTLACSRRAADHHVGVLVREKILVMRRFGRETALFVPGAGTREEADRMRLLRKRSIQALLLALERHRDGLSQAGLSSTTGKSRPYVSRLVRRLVACGLVEISAVPPARRWARLTHAGRSLIAAGSHSTYKVRS